MSTPTKPERVEVGARWANPLCNPKYNPHTVVAMCDFERGGEMVPGVLLRTANGEERHWPTDGLCYWALVSPAPATPGTAMVTPEPLGIDYGLEPSKPPASPVYGRLVGELRAPDGTPRTALEAIQAKREPEPWRPAVDEWDLLPDADEGWRR